MAEIVQYHPNGADPYPLPDDPELELGAEDTDPGEMTEGDGGAAATGDEVPTLGQEPGDDDPVGQAAYRHWQGVFTRHREKDVSDTRKLRDEHAQFSGVLAQFNNDDQFAMDVIRRRFPHLADSLQSGAAQPAQGSQESTNVSDLLRSNLGEDLSFLAPALAPALEAIVAKLVGDKVAPISQQITAQSNETRRREEDRLMAEMDGINENWRERYGNEMKELDEFLGSDQLSHPKFGSKYQLYHRLLNPDTARIDAARSMGDAARSAVRTGRTGTASVPNTIQQMAKASSDRDAWAIATRAAIAETEGR